MITYKLYFVSYFPIVSVCVIECLYKVYKYKKIISIFLKSLWNRRHFLQRLTAVPRTMATRIEHHSRWRGWGQCWDFRGNGLPVSQCARDAWVLGGPSNLACTPTHALQPCRVTVTERNEQPLLWDIPPSPWAMENRSVPAQGQDVAIPVWSPASVQQIRQRHVLAGLKNPDSYITETLREWENGSRKTDTYWKLWFGLCVGPKKEKKKKIGY